MPSLTYLLNNTGARPLLWGLERYESLRPQAVALIAEGTPCLRYQGYPAGELNVLRLAVDLLDRCGERSDPRPAASTDDADIVLHGVHAKHASSVADRRAFLVCPFRVHLVVDTQAPDQLAARLSKREVTERHRFERQAHWHLERTRSAGLVDEFYASMYRPTMNQRHGQAQRTESPRAAHAIRRRGALYRLHRNGKWVAGALCTEQGRVLTTRLLGVADDADAQYRGGALKMLYFRLLEMAAAGDRFHTVDLYGTEAMIAKGIFQWKRRLGAYPVLPDTHWRWKRLVWELRRDTPQVRDYLNASPLLLMRGESFQPVYFFDDDRPPRHEISSKCPGLAAPRQYHLDDLLAGLPHPGRIGDIRVRS